MINQSIHVLKLSCDTPLQYVARVSHYVATYLCYVITASDCGVVVR